MPKNEQPQEGSSKPFNPLSKAHLARSVADALLAAAVHPLPPQVRFTGSGVYAIYYIGSLPIYQALLARNSSSKTPAPIYVGKAIPSGGRKGGMDFESAIGNSLLNRLSEHADSIAKASNLRASDFQCRYLVVDDIWIPLAESMLIDRFRPLWNLELDGFGNHDPGSGRHQQKRSPWDVIHPGREWAEKLQPCARSSGEIESRIAEFFQALDGR
ncbi:MAG: Eco29kI family restriction endonuclease [Acidobacteriota bacterium]|nr:Eco29kI family restriction endonuclease [Acidobacteriota bacterium]